MSANIRLLIVDDEERFLRTLTRRLALRDFDVTSVTEGGDALRAAQAQPFELALVDLKMPGMDGEEVLARLRAEHPFLEVIILTGHGSVESAVECAKAGSRHFLQKPAEMDTLLTVLMEAYAVRMRRRHELDEKEMASLMRSAVDESPLAVLRKLKDLDEESRRPVAAEPAIDGAEGSVEVSPRLELEKGEQP